MNKEPISVDEAQEILEALNISLPAEVAPLAAARGRVLAADLFSPLDLPRFAQSGMDGYAFRFADLESGGHEKGGLEKGDKEKGNLLLSGLQAAGGELPPALLPGRAMRIFTGAALPAGADTVVMQEKAQVQGDRLQVLDPGISAGAHVRAAGSDCREGALLLRRGTALHPAALALLAGAGLTTALVSALPRVAVIVTGNELQQPGLALQGTQVYESNSFSLVAALQQAGITEVEVERVRDDQAAITGAIGRHLRQADLLLLTGGVSVGDFDFVVPAALNAGVQPLFHKVWQRPGKPLFAGRTEKKLVFGLPGNPGSVMTCFYQWVRPALLRMMGAGEQRVFVDTLLSRDYHKPAHLTCFVKGILADGKVEPLDGQESYRMSSFALANALIRLDAGKSAYLAGDTVKVQLIPV